jgi:Zn-finger nucleic acid-binding protein
MIMKCPKCSAVMEKVKTPEAVVDRCTLCKGLWFDLLEYKEVRGKAAERLDLGDSQVGRKYDKQRRVECPHCAQRMTRMTARGQPHIHYEQCPTCHGVFFDAGEFRDLQSMTFGDMIQGLFSRERA